MSLSIIIVQNLELVDLQTAGCPNKALEEPFWPVWPAQEFRVVLSGNKELLIRDFNDFHQVVVWRNT